MARERRGRRESREDSGRGGKRKFTYKRRSSESVKKRAAQSSFSNEDVIREDVDKFIPKKGLNTIRFLPPTWDDPEHYGYDIYVHYNIGSDRSAYLCLDKMLKEPCPICEERLEAENDGDDDYAAQLKANKRVLAYVIDRDNEDQGVLVWSQPWTIDRDLALRSTDKRTGEVLPIDDPEDGYDVDFTREGEGRQTKYVGIDIARRSSDLGNEDWLDFVVDNPLPDVLVFHDYDHIKKAFAGTPKAKKEEKEDKDDRRSRRDKRDDDKDDKNLPTWDEVHDMEPEEMDDLVDEFNLDLNPDDFDNDDEYADAICEDLDIRKPKRGRRGR